MKEYQPTTFFEALFGGLGAARRVVSSSTEKAFERTKDVTREVLIYHAGRVSRSIVEAKANFHYRRRLRLA